MNGAIVWAPRAFADLEKLLDFIARDEPATARRFGQKVLNRIESLADFPDSGSFVPEDESQIYREVFQGPYRIIFRREQSHVVIVAIHHGARLLRVDNLERDEG
jgi:plasmid stabilization system protein ParE